MTIFSKDTRKSNRNKKGFTLVELLISVAILAVLTPVIVKAFIYGAELNMRSRFQQRADAAANSVYEQVAALDYEELADFFSDANGWKDIRVDEGTTKLYDYHAKKYYDALEDCEVKVAVTRYPESYIIPDLSFIGVDSEYLTLSKEVNAYDDIISEKILQTIKSHEGIKNKVKDELEKNHQDIKTENITIKYGSVDKDDISKDLDVVLTSDTSSVKAEYTLSYSYDVSRVEYDYRYEDGPGNWKGGSGTAEFSKDVTVEAKFDALSKSVSVASDVENVKIFIYYSPYSENDEIDISAEVNTSDKNYTVYFIEEGELIQPAPEEGGEPDNTDSIEYKLDFNKNFKKISYIDGENGNYKQISNSQSIILYSNNPTISKDGIPDDVYESSSGEENLFKIQVDITYKSTFFANVTGTFKPGGGEYESLLS